MFVLGVALLIMGVIAAWLAQTLNHAPSLFGLPKSKEEEPVGFKIHMITNAAMAGIGALMLLAHFVGL